MWLSALPVVLLGIIAVTVMGNIFVVIAFFRDARIRSTVSNFFILNLAFTDLSVGSVVMTVNLIDIIMDQWLLGETFCKLWSTFEFTMTLMSTLTMLMISWDRYCLLTMGMAYKTYQTRKRLGIVLSICWSSCLIFYGALAFGWEYLFAKSSIDYSVECEMEFLTNLNATIVVNVIEFVLPFTLLLILNILVYSKIRGRSIGVIGISQGNQLPLKSVSNDISTIIIPIRVPKGEENGSLPQTSKTCLSRIISQQPGSSEEQRGDKGDVYENMKKVHFLEHSETRVSRSMRLPIVNCNSATSNTSPLSHPTSCKEQTTDSSVTNKAKGIVSKHRKAALVLTILSSCYFLCYTPYSICSTVYAICNFECTNDFVWEITSYLLWCNSALNPFIYAATNVHFRRNFRQFLLLDKWTCDLKSCHVKRQSDNIDKPSIAET